MEIMEGLSEDGLAVLNGDEPLLWECRNILKHRIAYFGVQNPDIEDMVERIVAAGGKQLMPIRYYYKGEKPYRMCYVKDPFGIIFEIYSHSYELTYSSGAYEEA